MNINTTNQLLQSISFGLLNSLWQMAFLWVLYQILIVLFKPKYTIRYLLLTCFHFISLALFIYSIFLNFYNLNYSVEIFNIFKFNYTTNSKLQQVISVFYLLFVLVFIIKLLIQLLQQNLNSKKLSDYDNSQWNEFINITCSRFKINKIVLIKITQEKVVPFTVGFLKPIIVLPIAAINNLNAKELETILIHELAHVKRQDYIVNLCLLICECILCFNPFSKIFNNEINILREVCCDEIVVNYPNSRIDYTEALCHLTKNHFQKNQYPVTIAATNNNFYLKNRIEKILFGKQFIEQKISKLQIAFVLIYALCVILLIDFTNNNIKQLIALNNTTSFSIKNQTSENIYINKVAKNNIVQRKITNSKIKNKKSLLAIKENDCKTELNELNMKQDLISMNLKELAEDIIATKNNNENIRKIDINSNAEKDLELISTINKDNTTTEKYFIPASTDGPASMIIITTTTTQNGKREVKFEIEKVSSRIN